MTLFGPGKKRDDQTNYRQVSLLALVPTILLVAPLIGFFIGQWLDKKFDTEPILMTIGVFLGFGSAGIEIYKLVKKSQRMEEEDNDE
ncbi:MAG: AtpZ/AtpI family protein [candidate division Zixibacteria bacterium]|nr:AtpZ/AtpI family protein [candidate division Zixibacteria bacterium]